ncbi:alpha/beta hydrolase [Microvirga sp. STR05]|uniref:Alpha/beta hydrolase n=1 Tax=Hymenobacter duratus TaxID=2771356 RepID=A0ABR8JI15_9BACT|nr:alpha/beta hydrolase [Hymenobacter duratus]MBD2716490.1 alpha/beta hydrolase [Hymenobacter duratus]MBR7951405.1 alpha/beta hydrolase [Microvirga sp. STR05]
MAAFHYSFRTILLSLFLLTVSLSHAQQATGKLTNGPTTLLTSDSVQLYVQVAGQGTPCVYVHGGPGAGSYSFEKLGGNRLEDHLRLIYFDQRGSGRSASSSRQHYSMARMVQDLEELRQHLGLEKWVVMAHSFGGTIATAYATQYPQRVQALVLVNAVLNPPASLESMLHYGNSLLPAAAQPNPGLPMMQRVGMVMGALQQQKMAWQLQFSADSMAARAGRVSRAVAANPDFGTQVFSGQLPDYGQDLVPATARLLMPVLNIVGQDDRTTGAMPGTFRFPKQQTVTLPGKHNSFLEQPATFRQAVVSFVQKLPR